MSIFKGYDIRGVYGENLTEEAASGIGKAFATFLIRKKPKSKTIIVGRDNRSSSLSLRNAFCDSLHFAGFDIVDIGIVSTSLIQYAVSREKVAGAAMITASHNPAQYNGFKLYIKNLPLMAGQMLEVEKIYNSKKIAKFEKQGHEMHKEIEGDYISDVQSRVKLHRKLRVVIDSGNGTCGKVAHDLFKRMGCDVTSLFEDMESAFMNHVADPHNPANLKWLQAEVLNRSADLGIAFDGDGDRAGFVDEKGQIIREDDASILFLRHELQKQKGAIIYDLRLSRSIPEEIRKLKGKPVMSKAGRIAIRENLISNRALFGGEVSGHYFFADHYGFDDGIYAGAKMCEIISGMNGKLSHAISQMTKYPSTPELRIHVENEQKAAIVENVKKELRKKYGKKVLTLDGVYLNLENGWGLLRVSNTEPAITLRFEGKTKKELREIFSIFEKLLKIQGVKLSKIR
jgi:phosphomannomutase / phosphoglucomutase